jgi:DNA-binding beta-propeller fold protein YncE
VEEQRPQVTLVTTIGTPEGGPGGAGRVEFNNPAALAVDHDGNLIVADTGNHRLVKVDRNGTHLWAVGGHGTAQGEFDSPQAVCIDTDNNIYVADTLNTRVQKLSPAGEPLTIWGGWGAEYGQFGGDGPLGIAIDEHGFVLVSDSHTASGGNHRIQKFDPDGHYVGQFGSYGTGGGQFGGSAPIRQYGYDHGPGIGPGPIGPAGIAVNTNQRDLLELRAFGGTIFVADCDNDRIVIFYGTGIHRPASYGTMGEGVLYRPRQLALDSRGRLYVSGLHHHEPPILAENMNDPFNWRLEPECRWIAVFDSGSGDLLGKLDISGVHDGLTHQPRSGLHYHGYGVAVDPSDDGNVYVQGGNAVYACRVEWPA